MRDIIKDLFITNFIENFRDRAIGDASAKETLPDPSECPYEVYWIAVPKFEIGYQPEKEGPQPTEFKRREFRKKGIHITFQYWEEVLNDEPR